MNLTEWLDVSDEVRSALARSKPIVALESTLIAHGLPWPVNVETALEAEQAVRAEFWRIPLQITARNFRIDHLAAKLIL